MSEKELCLFCSGDGEYDITPVALGRNGVKAVNFIMAFAENEFVSKCSRKKLLSIASLADAVLSEALQEVLNRIERVPNVPI